MSYKLDYISRLLQRTSSKRIEHYVISRIWHLLDNIKDNQIEELKKFHKSYFDVDNIVNTASELKYMNELKTFIHTEFQNPTDGTEYQNH